MLVVVKIVVVEVDSMVLSDSVDSDMLELNMLDSALDNEVDSSESSWPEVDSEANTEELAIVPWVEAVAIDEASSLVEALFVGSLFDTLPIEVTSSNVVSWTEVEFVLKLSTVIPFVVVFAK